MFNLKLEIMSVNNAKIFLELLEREDRTIMSGFNRIQPGDWSAVVQLSTNINLDFTIAEIQRVVLQNFFNSGGA